VYVLISNPTTRCIDAAMQNEDTCSEHTAVLCDVANPQSKHAENSDVEQSDNEHSDDEQSDVEPSDVKPSGVKRSLVEMSTGGQVHGTTLLEGMLSREVPCFFGEWNSANVADMAPCVEYAFIRDLASHLFETLGPGFSEAVYQKAMSNELFERRIPHEMKRIILVVYKQLQVGVVRADIVVQNAIVVELKRVVRITSAHLQQAEMYARLLRLSKIIVINFPCVGMAPVQVCVYSEDSVWGKMPSSPQS